MAKPTCMDCGITVWYTSTRCEDCFHKFNSGEQNGMWKKKAKKICSFCGKNFEIYPSHSKKGIGKFCSQACYGKSNCGKPTPILGKSNPYKGERHWNWKGGIADLSKTERERFGKYFRKKVLERDNYTCQMCGANNCVLQVDHIQPWSDYLELRFDLNNCRTLCVECHYSITFKKPPNKKSTWGRYFRKEVAENLPSI